MNPILINARFINEGMHLVIETEKPSDSVTICATRENKVLCEKLYQLITHANIIASQRTNSVTEF